MKPHTVGVYAMRSLLVLFLTAFSSVTAQQPPTTAEEFQAAGAEERRLAMIDIIEHRSDLPAGNVVGIIGVALRDPDPVMRVGALAAVVSRAAAPRIVRGDAVLKNWARDQSLVQGLRSDVIRALADPVERVRREAVGALVSLDFDPQTLTGRPAPETERLLTERFHADPDAGVRARIVSGFASDPTQGSALVQQLLSDAFSDGDRRVRQAAAGGAQKLEAGLALFHLIRQLDDGDSTARLHAALAIAKFGARASSYGRTLESALEREMDPGVAEALRMAMRAVGPSVP